MKHKYAMIIKGGDTKNDIPKKLKISPVEMIPHKSNPFRCIMGLSFALLHKDVKLSSVNKKTRKMARPEAMAQLGQVVKIIIYLMALHRHHGLSFKFSKLDIKDGFWGMAVSNKDAWKFCYVLPSLKDCESMDDIELVVTNSLQMGRYESPPLF